MRRDVYTSPRCPADAAHGPMLAWPSSFAGWYCPSQTHDGNPFYRTDLAAATRSGSDEIGQRQGPTEAQTASTRTRRLLPPVGSGTLFD